MRSKVHNARQHTAALRAALLSPSPERLEAQLAGLEQAIHGLAEIQPEQIHSADDSAELRRLARELKTVSKLIAHGMASQQGWARLLAASLAGYLSDGQPMPLAAKGSISVAG